MGSYTIKSFEGKLILAATILASGMAFLDGTVVNIAIPVIQSSFHTTIAGIQWVINSYILILGSLILISGSLGDRYGRKKIFSYGIGLFIFSSFLCGVAQSIEQLIIFRSLQGIGAAMMIPGSLSIIHNSFVDNVQGKAIGLWSGFAGGVAALGPFLGGWLVQTFGWQSIFYINIPIGILALFLTLRYVPESKNEDAKHLDLFGTLLLFLSLLGMSYALIESPSLGINHPFVVGSSLISILSFIGFVLQEKKAKEPLVPFQIFNSSLVIGANIVTLFLYFALNGVIFFFILNLQQLQHYSPLAAGLSMLPAILIITFLSGPAGSLSDKIGPRLPMIIGPAIVSIGMVLLLLPGQQANYFVSFLPGLVLFGCGMALLIAPLTKSALSVDRRYSGSASGVNNAVSRVAALLAVALLGAIMATVFTDHLVKNIAQTSLSHNEKQQILMQKDMIGGIQIPQTFHPEQKIIAQKAIEDSFLFAFRTIIGIGAFLALISSVIAFFMIHNKQK